MERRRKIVKVTRRGQTTIPIEFRKRHRIEEGSRLVVEDRGDAIVLRPVPRLQDLGGFLSKTPTVERLLKILAEARGAGACERPSVPRASGRASPGSRNG